MNTKFEWRDHKFEITSKAIARYFFCGTQTKLFIDGEEICVADGLGFSAEGEGSHVDKNGIKRNILLSVSSKAWTLGYVVRIDGTSVSSGHLSVQNLWLSIIPGLIMVAGVFGIAAAIADAAY